MRYLLDTHILLRRFDVKGTTLSRAHQRATAKASAASPLWVSDISLWEIAMLVERGRVRLRQPLREWLEAATAPPLVERLGISPAIAAATLELPPDFHGDPADRLLVATARIHGATLLTEDERILASKACLTL